MPEIDRARRAAPGGASPGAGPAFPDILAGIFEPVFPAAENRLR